MKRREIFSIPLFVVILTTVLMLAGCGGGADGGGGGGNGGTGTINLAWDAVITYVDGTDCIVDGYKVYVGTASGTYGTSIDVRNVITYTLTGLTPGQIYYIAVTAYDTSGIESTYSIPTSGPAR